ncbi:chemotaxis protein CheW, partial [Aliivibrio fischeri]|nr:chemotaxis protein CheW [Aliivibrio fischeri]MUL12207.1 chemotaxis protein CheW [Aliivibrio fischeri]
MADFKTFTSEEALDDYFSSLLDEDVIEQDVNLEEVREELVEPEPV